MPDGFTGADRDQHAVTIAPKAGAPTGYVHQLIQRSVASPLERRALDKDLIMLSQLYRIKPCQGLQSNEKLLRQLGLQLILQNDRVHPGVAWSSVRARAV